MRLVRCLSTSLTAVLVVLAFSATQAAAAGFRLPEAGAKAMGMGFAFTAQADDPSAIYFNPAGLTQLEGQNVTVGVTYIRRYGDAFTGITPLTGGAVVSETQKDLNFFIPNAYYVRKASPNLAYGVGLFVPFGLGLEYRDRNTSIFRNQITMIDLMTLVVNPTVAWKVNDVLSVGAGIDFLYGKAKMERTPVSPALGGNIYNLDLEADGTAWGYNFGLLLAPSRNLKIGLSHRSPFTLKLKDGDVNVTNISPEASAMFFDGATTFQTKGSAVINLPATTAFGAAYTFFDRLTVEADLDFTWWSSYKNLRVEIRDENPVLMTTDSRKDWNDVVALRIGAEYRVTDPLALRVGFAYDPTPVPAETMGPELPDATRLNYMVGVGYKYGNWTFDASYFYVDKKERTVSNIRAEGANTVGFDGIWKGDGYLVALDIGYRF
jgi:long-chain fatty acid transport protein